MAGKVVKFVVKTTVAGGLVYFTINLTHGPWSAPPKIARLADSEAFVDHAAIGGYQELEVCNKNIPILIFKNSLVSFH